MTLVEPGVVATELPNHITHAGTKQEVQQFYDKAEVTAEDVTLRICTRAAIILSSDTDPAPAIFADVKALYDLRSSLVHGSIITQKQLEKWLAAVSTVPAPGDCTPRMRNEQLIDRLRDLVSRSILMRLLLNSDGRWPLRVDPPPPVDQLWTDPAIAGQWRAAWHQGSADLGAPDAAQPAPPLRDSIFDDYPCECR